MPETWLTELDCPVCASAAKVVSSPDRDATISAMEGLLKKSGLSAVMPGAQSMRSCNQCGLAFADPMIEPGPAFYQWLTHANFSYPTSRWEWNVFRDLIASLPHKVGDEYVVLDVGSGDGGFLKVLLGLPGVRAIGIEHNPDAIGACRVDGLDVVQGGFDEVGSLLPGGRMQ